MIRKVGALPVRAWAGVASSVLVAAAALALPLRITPPGIEPPFGAATAALRTASGGVPATSDAGMPSEHRDDPHPHEAHCFWCIVLVGPVISPTLVGRAQALSPGVPARSGGVVRPRGLDLSFAPRAPPPLADLPR